MQVKTTVVHHLNLFVWLLPKVKISAHEYVKKREPLFTADANVNQNINYGKLHGGFSKN